MSTVQQFDASVDVLSALLWQQNNATTLQTILQLKQTWYQTNQQNFWDNWYRDVFDLRTANGFGRRVWSVILGVPLSATLNPTTPGKPTWGFSNKRKNFNRGNFSSKTSQSAGLTAEQERLVLQLRYFQLICRPTVPEINRFLKYAFRDEGNVYVLDPLDMTFAVYIFNFNPGSQLAFVIENFDLLPRPSTVGVKYQVLTRKAFGFSRLRKNFKTPSNFQTEST